MKTSPRGFSAADSNSRKSCLYGIFPVVLIAAVFYFMNSVVPQEPKQSGWPMDADQSVKIQTDQNVKVDTGTAIDEDQNVNIDRAMNADQNVKVDTGTAIDEDQNVNIDRAMNADQNVKVDTGTAMNADQNVKVDTGTAMNADQNVKGIAMDADQNVNIGTAMNANENVKVDTASPIDKCKKQCRPNGSEALPAGIVSATSSFELRRLWTPHIPKKMRRHIVEPKVNASTNLFAVAVGIKQKDLVNKMVKKFIDSNFMVMLFHYDGIVDKWEDLEWNSRVIHVSAIDQSKWWFAKRFLHPDIVAEYDYIFLWDEDLGVEHFDPDEYLSIIKSEGLEISQPALDNRKSEVHHQITTRWRRSTVHRRTYKAGNDGKGCDKSSTTPPCTGWIEIMAPVFSRAAWRCVWYMIQNDLIHAWGLDMQLGYCAQGDRTKNVGVVDAQYVVHYNRPTLGGTDATMVSSGEKDHRTDVRRLSYEEFDVFKKRWEKAVKEDGCWVDPFH